MLTARNGQSALEQLLSLRRLRGLSLSRADSTSAGPPMTLNSFAIPVIRERIRLENALDRGCRRVARGGFGWFERTWPLIPRPINRDGLREFKSSRCLSSQSQALSTISIAAPSPSPIQRYASTSASPLRGWVFCYRYFRCHTRSLNFRLGSF